VANPGIGVIPVLEAVEWREPAPGGGSKSQIFRLSDGNFAVVKFPENPQGELVLANELLCCQLAERLGLPLNRARLVVIDERIIRTPRQSGKMPADFSAGVRCGMLRFDQYESCQPQDILTSCENASELHSVALFEQWVGRSDGQQLLMYPGPSKKKRFAAYDYGFAFGGQPNWSAATLAAFAPPTLPSKSPFDGAEYKDGAEIRGTIELLGGLSKDDVSESLGALFAPRWGVTAEALDALIGCLIVRAQSLVQQFKERYVKQMEIPDVHD